MKVRKIKKSVKIILLLFCLFIFVVLFAFNVINYYSSFKYKLEKLGYSKDEISYIYKRFKNNLDNSFLNIPYSHNTLSFMKERYFIFSNLDRYLKYYDDNKERDFGEIIGIVNSNRDYEFYENAKEVDLSKGNGILVNKYYYLKEDYEPSDIVSIPSQYAYYGNSIKKEVLDAYIDMWNCAYSEGITLIVSASYRDYKWQDDTFNEYVRIYGEKYALKNISKAGYSDHGTGLALDIVTYSGYDSFSETKAYSWLIDNAYKYGFILRYPLGKDEYTGYAFEPWHYRYVGKDLAREIYEADITFDEYYAYYMDK